MSPAASAAGAAGGGTKARLEAFAAQLAADGLSVEETTFASHSGQVSFSHEVAPLGTADLVAGLFLPRADLAVSTAATLGEGLDALKDLSANAAGSGNPLESSRRRALEGVEETAAKAAAELSARAGDMISSPLTILGELNKRALASGSGGDAAARFASRSLAGEEGPLARAMADMAERGGVRPAEIPAAIAADLSSVMRHAQPGDILFGLEGSARAVQLHGSIARGSAELLDATGEVHDEPSGLAEDLKKTAVQAAAAATKGFRDTARAIYRWFRGVSK